MESFSQTWWDKNIEENLDLFLGWVGDENKYSKVFMREYVISNGYRSLADLGCGPASEFFGYKKDCPDMKYLGVDSSSFLFNRNLAAGVPMLLANIEDTNLPDDSYEVAFSRHVLEHQPGYEKGLGELIRIASKEAIHVFFIAPKDGPETISHDKKENLYHNRYNRKDIESFLNSNKKVVGFDWIECSPEQEIALCIKVKNQS
jgi:ubiquinone/menaquinone biosynthesis C-methylase UbiE